MLHLTTIGGVVAALVLFAVMLTTSLAADQPDNLCDSFAPLQPSSNLLPELLAGVDDVLRELSTSGAPETPSDVFELGGLLVGHVGIESPCNATDTGRVALFEVGEKCAQTTQLAGFSEAFGAQLPSVSSIPELQHFCFSVDNARASNQLACHPPELLSACLSPSSRCCDISG